MNTPDPRDPGACTHFQPADLVALVEEHLRAHGVPETEWDGRRFEWGGVIDSPPFTGLVMGCKRKDGQWVITKLDRRKDGVKDEETGLREVAG